MSARERNKIIRYALESVLEVLGHSGKVAFIEDLERNGSYQRYGDDELSLAKISEGLRGMFGDDMSESFMERVLCAMDKLSSAKKSADAS